MFNIYIESKPCIIELDLYTAKGIGTKTTDPFYSDVPRFRIVVATRDRVGFRNVVWDLNFVCQR